MAAHLYSAFWTKTIWFVKRFGVSELLLKPLRTILAPLIIPFIKQKPFTWKTKSLLPFIHKYNMTWAGERAVEIPIAMNYLSTTSPAKTLEVGNVLQHYSPVTHTIVDKFEHAAGVTNVDILDFQSGRKYDLIISISTFEHIGFDDDSTGGSGQKIQNAINHCRDLLSDNGVLVITVPMGYNPELDAIIRANQWSASSRHFLYRTGYTEWEETDEKTAFLHPYRCRFPYANAIMVAEFNRGGTPSI